MTPDVIVTTPVERAIARARVLGIFGTNRPNPGEVADEDAAD
jgi:hypothetical protein